jgi:hypothetical protein
MHGQLNSGFHCLLGTMGVLVEKKSRSILHQAVLAGNATLYAERSVISTACASVKRGPRTRSPTRAWSLTLGLGCTHRATNQVPASPYIFLLLMHQAVPPGMEMGSRASRGRVVRAAWGSQVEAILVEFHHPIWDLIGLILYSLLWGGFSIHGDVYLEGLPRRGDFL